MSKRLTYMVGASRHPLLMEDPIARDVLWHLADLAQERRDCHIIAPIEALAETMGRGMSAVRHAVDRLITAGLVEVVGVGSVNKRLRVLKVAESLLGVSFDLGARNAKIAQEVTSRNESGIATSNLPRPCRDSAATLPRPCRDPAVYARAGLEHGTRNKEQEQEPENTENAGAGAPVPVVGNGKAEVNAIEFDSSGALESQPEASERQQPREATEAEARIQAAVDELMPALCEYHLLKAGSTASGRLTTSWRSKLATRVADDGVTAERIAARVAGIRATLRWWGLPTEAEAQPGEVFCFYNLGGRRVAKLLETANHLDKLIDWAASPQRKPGRHVGPGNRGEQLAVHKPWAKVGAVDAAVSPVDPEQQVTDAEIEKLLSEVSDTRHAPAAPAPQPSVASPARMAEIAGAFSGLNMAKPDGCTRSGGQNQL